MKKHKNKALVVAEANHNSTRPMHDSPVSVVSKPVKAKAGRPTKYQLETVERLLAAIAPRLSIVSPTENCGKSTFLRVLRLFVSRPMPSANLSPATGFRLVELHKPTLLCDETNKWLVSGSELVGILNSGYETGSFVHRCIGDKARA
jgi:hypothetical protein